MISAVNATPVPAQMRGPKHGTDIPLPGCSVFPKLSPLVFHWTPPRPLRTLITSTMLSGPLVWSLLIHRKLRGSRQTT